MYVFIRIIVITKKISTNINNIVDNIFKNNWFAKLHKVNT